MTEICPIDDIDFQKNYTDGRCDFYAGEERCDNFAVWSIKEDTCNDVFVCEDHLPK
jgi:NAD-dependent dihydropyrimidine dehydrogenase PreA subunit